jgi:hypothetical protein
MAQPDPLERPRTPIWLVLAVSALALLGAIWVIKMVLGIVMWIIAVALILLAIWALVAVFGRKRSGR